MGSSPNEAFGGEVLLDGQEITATKDPDIRGCDILPDVNGGISCCMKMNSNLTMTISIYTREGLLMTTVETHFRSTVAQFSTTHQLLVKIMDPEKVEGTRKMDKMV